MIVDTTSVIDSQYCSDQPRKQAGNAVILNINTPISSLSHEKVAKQQSKMLMHLQSLMKRLKLPPLKRIITTIIKISHQTHMSHHIPIKYHEEVFSRVC